jgi:two-component system response regulator TctD
VARLRVVKTVWGHCAGGPGTSPEDIEVLERNLSDTQQFLATLTARASVPDRVLGLNMGADDYLPKPFDLSELEARLQVLLRRHGRAKTTALRWGPLEMQPENGTAQLHGQVLALTQREAAALRVLLSSPQRTVSKEQLHSEVFADEAAGLDAVEVLIYRLRKKLESSSASHIGPAEVVITTFRGMGYMLTSPLGTA